MVKIIEDSSGTKMTRISELFQATPKQPNVKPSCLDNLEENKSDG